MYNGFAIVVPQHLLLIAEDHQRIGLSDGQTASEKRCSAHRQHNAMFGHKLLPGFSCEDILVQFLRLWSVDASRWFCLLLSRDGKRSRLAPTRRIAQV